MRQRVRKWVRVVTPLLGSAVLLQASSCAVDFNAIAAGLANSITTDFITDLVFRAFNLAP